MSKPIRPQPPPGSVQRPAKPLMAQQVRSKSVIAPAVYRPQPTPKVLQRKATAVKPQLLPAKSAAVAPPAYRPQRVAAVLQPKIADPQQPTPPPKRTPVAPPAYRPMPMPKVLQRKTDTNHPQPNPQLQLKPAASSVNRPRPAPKVSQPQPPGSRQPSAGPANRQTVALPVARPTQKKIVQPKAAPTPRPGQNYFPNQAARRATIIQRTIDVQNIDYDPVANQYRQGAINQGNFYNALRASINNTQAFHAYRNQVNNVIASVSGQNFANPDIDTLTASITTAVRNEYQGRGQVINSNNLVTSLTNFVRNALVANIQHHHQTTMSQGEANAYDALAQVQHVTRSRAKGVPNTIPYANLPNNVQQQVAARLTEIRNERARWTVAAVAPEHSLENRFSSEICTRQRQLRYQGNHSNNAGWLPAVGAPADQIAAIGNAIYNQASRGLQRILSSRNPLQRMDYAVAGGNLRQNRYRTEYELLHAAALLGITNQDVKMSAMAALCQGVSAYIEFSMAGDISRLMYDPVNGRVYICAHYKWREGYNPFFEVLNFPAV